MTKKTVAKSGDNKPVKTFMDLPDEKFEKFILKNLQMQESPENLLKEIKSLYSEAFEAKGKKRTELEKAVNEKGDKFSRAYGVESKFNLLVGVEKSKQAFALRMYGELEKEYEVKTYSEKVLVQTAVIAYCRIQESIQDFRRFANDEWLSSGKGQYLGVFGKEIDRANRQFFMALQTLKNMKQPPLKVSVNAKTAFVAQNQQNNANSPLLENNDPQ